MNLNVVHAEATAAKRELAAGQPLEAAQRLERLLRKPLDDVIAWNTLGEARVALKLWVSAEAAFERVTALAPDTYPCWHNLLICACRGRFGAEAVGRRTRMALGMSRDLPAAEALDAARRAAVELRDQGDVAAHAEAAEAAAQAWVERGGADSARAALGLALLRQRRFADALPIWEALTARHASDASILANLACAQSGLGRHGEAVALYRQVLLLAPDNHAAMHNLAYELRFVGDPGHEGPGLIERAIGHEAHPAYLDARAVARLRAGDYAGGFADYELRLQNYTPGDAYYDHVFRLRDHGMAIWTGEDVRGKRVFVHPEQGHGDVFMGLRFLRPLVERAGAAHVGFFASDNLERYARACDAGPDVRYYRNVPIPEFDVYVPMLSLMHLLRVASVRDIPPPMSPTLDPASTAVWSARVGGSRVGLTWRGSDTHPLQALRTIPFEQFLTGVVRPLLDHHQSVVCLQKDATPQERAALQTLGVNCHWIDLCEDWYDTAGLVSQLSALVGVDTALIHLAGSLGLPTVMINRMDALSDWRWLSGRTDSPWYPSLQIVSQTVPGSWREPMARAVRHIEDLEVA